MVASIEIYTRDFGGKKWPVKVNSVGEFYCRITDEEYSVLLDEHEQHIRKDKTGAWCLFVPQYGMLKTILHTYVAWADEKTTTKSLWIEYRFDNRCNYVKHFASGELYPNGTLAPGEYGKDSNWNDNGASSNNPVDLFSMGVAGRVMVKIIEEARDGTKREKWENTCYHKELETPAIENLNAFASVAITEGGFRHVGGKRQLVPYDEDLAMFLYDAMMTVCKLADRMEDFFKDHETTMLAAKSNASLLTGPAPEPKKPVKIRKRKRTE